MGSELDQRVSDHTVARKVLLARAIRYAKTPPRDDLGGARVRVQGETGPHLDGYRPHRRFTRINESRPAGVHRGAAHQLIDEQPDADRVIALTGARASHRERP
ncbi:hypothetical protein NSERUTF1_1492 [Nocardia seriolae]|nr:hypothetical protein NSERUTF1_1492 [Nocardia seriolae]